MTGSDQGRRLAGDEFVVWFRDGDDFSGVTEEWLRPRLRLDPACKEVDLFERTGPSVFLNGEELEDMDIYALLGGDMGELCSYGNGGIIGGRVELVGGWLEVYDPELRHTLTWVGSDPSRLRELALERIADGMYDWEPQAHEVVEVTSPFLDPADASDRLAILAVAGDAGSVQLNGTELRPNPFARPIDH